MLPTTSKWKASTLDLGGEDEDGDPLVLYYRDPLECIHTLVSKPAVARHLVYAPQKEFKDVTKTQRVYGEMWMCKGWWETQVSATIKHGIGANAYMYCHSGFYHQAQHCSQ